MIKTKGSLLSVLKHGVEISNYRLYLMYTKPATTFNKELLANYETNSFSVMEEVWASDKERIDRVWQDSVSFMDLIQGADGYAVEYQKSFFINAELRVYDNNGTYSKTDSKQITIN